MCSAPAPTGPPAPLRRRPYTPRPAPSGHRLRRGRAVCAAIRRPRVRSPRNTCRWDSGSRSAATGQCSRREKRACTAGAAIDRLAGTRTDRPRRSRAGRAGWRGAPAATAASRADTDRAPRCGKMPPPARH
eukprot:ctg_4876.g672